MDQINEMNNRWYAYQEDTSTNWLNNIEEKYNKAVEYNNKLEKLKELNLDKDTIEALIGKGLDDDTLDRILGLSGEQLETLKDYIKKYQELPSTIADTAITVEADAVEKSKKAAEEATAETQKVLDTAATNAYESGVSMVKNLADGISDTQSKATDAASDLGEKTVDSAEYELNTKTGNNLGINLAQGVANGIYSRLAVVRAAAEALAEAASATVASELGIESPSKVFAEFGRYVDMGFANGITNAMHFVTNSVSTLSDTAIDTVSDAVFQMKHVIDTNVSESTFALTPVVDFSNISEQVSGINAQLSSAISANVSAAMEQSQTDRQLNLQLSRDIASLTNTVAGMQESLNDGSIANMNRLMQTYFPEFTKDIYLDGTKISNHVETNIVNGIKRRERAWS
jgi:hypothetical protein